MKKGFDYSFERSYNKLSIEDARLVKRTICHILKIDSSMEWYRRKKNWRNIPVWAYETITNVFMSMGIDKEEIFDIKPIED